jgi:hypothetical protein
MTLTGSIRELNEKHHQPAQFFYHLCAAEQHQFNPVPAPVKYLLDSGRRGTNLDLFAVISFSIQTDFQCDLKINL